MFVKIKKIMDEIARIAKIESPKKTQEEVRKLDRKIKAPKLKFVIRGNYCYVYLYKLEYRDNIQRTREAIQTSIGRIAKEHYLNNKKAIKQMTLEELKNYQYLEQY